MKHAVMLGALAAATWAAGSAWAGGSGGLVSGLQPGEPLTPFQIKDITGPNKGKELCYR